MLAMGLLISNGSAISGTHTINDSASNYDLKYLIAHAAAYDSIILDNVQINQSQILIDKPLTILGLHGSEIAGLNSGSVIMVRSTDVHIGGIKVTGVEQSFTRDNAAIMVEKSQRCSFEDIAIINGFFGIYFSNSSNCRVSKCQVNSNANSEAHSGNGIHLWHCRDMTIEYNEISGHRDGIYLEFVKSSIVRNNHSQYNLRYGLHFMFSDSCQYSDNNFIRNGAGVAVMYSKSVNMKSNNFERNIGPASYGLLLKDISHSNIEANRFFQNTIGIYAEGSSDLIVKANNFAENGWAIKLMANCIDDKFEDNNFINNAFQIATNSRQTSGSFDGNYWSVYKGYDIDKDGVGDVPFRPVNISTIIVEKFPISLTLLRSLFIEMLDVAERVFPTLTPGNLADNRPHMSEIK